MGALLTANVVAGSTPGNNIIWVHIAATDIALIRIPFLAREHTYQLMSTWATPQPQAPPDKLTIEISNALLRFRISDSHGAGLGGLNPH